MYQEFRTQEQLLKFIKDLPFGRVMIEIGHKKKKGSKEKVWWIRICC